MIFTPSPPSWRVQENTKEHNRPSRLMSKRIPTIVAALIAATSFLLLFYSIFGKTYPTTERPRFMVVDEYEGCDVVRYDDVNDARYHYFLHCK